MSQRLPFTREEFDTRPMRAIIREHKDQERTRFADYAACPECRALPGNPCRERGVWGGYERLNRVHPSRPKREAAS